MNMIVTIYKQLPTKRCIFKIETNYNNKTKILRKLPWMPVVGPKIRKELK